MARAHFRDVITAKSASGALVSLPGASVEVRQHGTESKVPQTLYSSATGSTTLGNPLTANVKTGEIDFWLDTDERVDLYIVAAGYSARTATVEVVSQETLSSPTIINPTIVGTGGTLTLPAGPDTLVGRATTDTLTNKTLSSPTLSGTIAGTPTWANAQAFPGPTKVKAASAGYGGGLQVERSNTTDKWELLPEAANLALGYNGTTAVKFNTDLSVALLGGLTVSAGIITTSDGSNGVIQASGATGDLYLKPKTSSQVIRLNDHAGVFSSGRIWIEAGGLIVKGQPGSPPADTSGTGTIVDVAGGNNGGANNTEIVVAFFRSDQLQGTVGFNGDTTTVVAGRTKTVSDLVLSDASRALLDTSGNLYLAGSAQVGTSFKVSTNQVVGARKAGWAIATGTATRTTFDTTTVTTAQLAERVKALLDDLVTHGLIGP